jgi:hypothetical protein
MSNVPETPDSTTSSPSNSDSSSNSSSNDKIADAFVSLDLASSDNAAKEHHQQQVAANWESFHIPYRELNPTDIAVWFKSEQQYAPNPFYMEKQWHIAPHFRTIVVHWMTEVAQEFCMGRDSVLLASNLMDRFLTINPSASPVQPKEKDEEEEEEEEITTAAAGGEKKPEKDTCNVSADINRHNFQLLAAACLLIAAKQLEVYPPNAKDFAVTTDGAYTAADVTGMEMLILKSVNWCLMPTTADAWVAHFLCALSKLARTQPDTRVVADQFLAVPLFTRAVELLDTANYNCWFLRFYPSAQAASVLLLLLTFQADKTVHNRQWPHVSENIIRQITDIEPVNVYPCVAELHSLLPLPHLGLSNFKFKPYFAELKMAERDMYTRQRCIPEALTLVQQLSASESIYKDDPFTIKSVPDLLAFIEQRRNKQRSSSGGSNNNKPRLSPKRRYPESATKADSAGRPRRQKGARQKKKRKQYAMIGRRRRKTSGKQ